MGNHSFQLLTIFAFMWFSFVVTNEHSRDVVQCIDSERQALLEFKEGFQIPSGHLSSWVTEEDCCKWRGVKCNNVTGHVLALDLHSSDSSELLQGQLRESLLDLPFLSYLDLSQNDFHRTRIPDFIGSLSSLKYLNLSNANFNGIIPDYIGNLTRLQSLDLSRNNFALRVNNLDWLSRLPTLQVLDLGGVDLSSAFNWLDAINMLPSLVELHLFSCQLHNLPLSFSSLNFTSLQVFDLSYNDLSSMIPNWLFDISHTLMYLNLTRCQLQGSISNAFVNFTSLVVLDFSYNYLSGSIPYNFGNMTSLSVLDISFNYLQGPIPTGLGLIQQLQQHHFKQSPLCELRLSYNKLSGPLETILPQLSQLVVLEVAANRLEGLISEAQLQNFSSLRVLDLSDNSMILNFSSNWTPAFQLETIGLSSCKMGSQFPQWLQSQKNIQRLDLSHADVSGTVPSWFWNLSPSMEFLDLSDNRLSGELPDLSSRTSMLLLDLSYNEFFGRLPHFPPKLESLVLDGNKFSGPISPICEMMNELNALSYLHLSGNTLSGQLPDCWSYAQNLLSLALRSNNFSGELPPSLRNCTTWFGESLENLQVLYLASNMFEGNIPWQLCNLKYIMMIDLSSHLISGRIPRCINNFLVMAKREADCAYCYYVHSAFAKEEERKMMWLGSHPDGYEYPMVMDFSSNKLTGEIPRELTELIGLAELNLSNNNLTGTIPCDIGSMKALYSLDLSRNQLSHIIPPSISDLIRLELLDLSNNNLSGKVPSTNSSSEFMHDVNSFMGNPNLCGPPLVKNCSTYESFSDTECSSHQKLENHTQGIQEEVRHGFEEMPSFYISAAIGFVTGFWGFWATLAFNKSWRHAYFCFLGNIGDKTYVLVLITIARLQWKFQREQASV
ncbi:hypothetical protein P3X46_013252 [Hevea brasiliensis]|uniref:Leucine-rich repeat-containing N-terminal plant-type domain-containing protein n=1 Tax=Hevea brasiliensis TaxID=3981 RepID=A0ABQ9M6J0_HEVBR|nr:hypothetical protein P3X46_013252 [Hevea brasiliensis]